MKTSNKPDTPHDIDRLLTLWGEQQSLSEQASERIREAVLSSSLPMLWPELFKIMVPSRIWWMDLFASQRSYLPPPLDYRALLRHSTGLYTPMLVTAGFRNQINNSPNVLDAQP